MVTYVGNQGNPVEKYSSYSCSPKITMNPKFLRPQHAILECSVDVHVYLCVWSNWRRFARGIPRVHLETCVQCMRSVCILVMPVSFLASLPGTRAIGRKGRCRETADTNTPTVASTRESGLVPYIVCLAGYSDFERVFFHVCRY